jgi:thiol-disulfide isomerase/thioredoxin
MAADPPRYRGLSGALSYGLFLFSVCLSLGLLGGVLVAGATGSVESALSLVLRVAAVALIVSAGVAFCRWVSGATADRMITRRYVRGDLSGLGLFVGIVLAGALTLAAAPPPLPRPVGGLAPGDPVEFTGPTLEGKPFELADYRGKVVFVDFWATWCGPCLMELPHVKETYDRYHADGFEVVGVSLDDDREVLARFVQERGLPWPQIFFDDPAERSWKSPLARRFGVRAIPFTILVDREGKLLATGLRGGEVGRAVAESLGRPAPETSWPDRLAEGGIHFLRWMFVGVLAAPLWLLLLTCWGGALVALLLEIGLRRVFGRRVPQTQAAPVK